MSLRGRNNIKEETFFFVTTTIVRHLEVFKDDSACDLLIKILKNSQNNYHFKILSYVIMPSHFHWIVNVDPTNGTISDIMRDIKKYSALDIMEYLNKNTVYTDVFKAESIGIKNQKRKFWQNRYDDKFIRNKKHFFDVLRYIHNNPVVAGLVVKAEEYKYSSARNYLYDDHSVIFVDTDIVGY